MKVIYKYQKSLILPILTVGILFLFNACDDGSGTGTDPEPDSQLEVHTVSDLDTGYGAFVAPNDTAYYSLRENSIVDKSDSVSTQWDVAFSNTFIYTNSESSGPGEGGAIVLDQSFENTVMAPSSGYAVDTTAANLAIPHGSDNGWYNYNRSTHIVTPIDNKTILVRTADGEHYAKLRIISWYEGNPDVGTNPPAVEDGGYYTFEYAIQLNGTREFTEE